MEYAIACDTLPSKKANGKYMAEFSVALTLGMLLGQTIDGSLPIVSLHNFVGMVLERFPVPDQEGAYTEEGYMVFLKLVVETYKIGSLHSFYQFSCYVAYLCCYYQPHKRKGCTSR